MERAAVWKDIAVGLLIAGALGAWVPQNFWKTFFLTSHPVAATLWGPIVGPLVAVLSFVCSVGNIPLAAVLWNGGGKFVGGEGVFLYGPHFFSSISSTSQNHMWVGARVD